jgi:hypothetical protein
LVRVLLISTYDLGRQPFGLASPAAWLRQERLEVTCVDTSRTDLQDADIASADVIAFYLPMHTATRLAEPLIARCRTQNPHARLVAYGLYAPLNAGWLRARGITAIVGPEAEAELVEIALAAGRQPGVHLPPAAAPMGRAGASTCAATVRSCRCTRGRSAWCPSMW